MVALAFALTLPRKGHSLTEAPSAEANPPFVTCDLSCYYLQWRARSQVIFCLLTAHRSDDKR